MNYHDFLKQIEQIRLSNQKPKLLLHSCCGPCSTYVINKLKEVFDLTIYYYNPNIYPNEEYYKRLEEQKKVINLIDSNIKIIEGFYDYNEYLNVVKGYENLGEKSIRCYNCYEFRLKKTYEYAIEHHFDYYTTTLSISPYKNSLWINEIMTRYSSKECQYLYSDFKKEDGYKKSLIYSKEFDLYRQDYCGCEFSQNEHFALLNRQNNIKD